MLPTDFSRAKPVNEQAVYDLHRPDDKLLTLFIIYAVLTGLGFPIVMLPMYFKFKTLRYNFQKEGVSMSYGILWRRESYVTYNRIQDIHVTRNIFERWLGLATLEIQSAAGSSGAAVSISGIRDYENIRDFLYARMRGAHPATVPPTTDSGAAPATDASISSITPLLEQIRDDIAATRVALERRTQ